MNVLDNTTTALIFQERDNQNIVIGVPHHAPAGIDKLPCNRFADENTGYLGQYIADRLGCCCIIACNYTLDVNKDMENEFVRQVLQWNPRTYIEVHGHKRMRTQNDVEITCGCEERNKESKIIVEKLCDKCHNDEELNWLKICGDFNQIFFKGKTAKTIQYKGWFGILFELAPELRYTERQQGGEPPRIGYKFCDYLVEIIRNMSLEGTS
jgi:hypothetical protein